MEYVAEFSTIDGERYSHGPMCPTAIYRGMPFSGHRSSLITSQLRKLIYRENYGENNMMVKLMEVEVGYGRNQDGPEIAEFRVQSLGKKKPAWQFTNFPTI